MSEQKNWAVIYCPREGSIKTQKRWKKILDYLEGHGVTFDYVQSEGPGSVERLAAMMTRTGYRTIIVVGGDAALNHALCGIMSVSYPPGGHPVLGVIPNGFGNDFAKYWGFSPNDYKATIDALICHRMRKVDVGQIKFISNKEGVLPPQYFLNCVNMGLAASITKLKRRTDTLFGLKSISYSVSALLLLFQRVSFKFSFSVNGEQFDRHAMSVCVGSSLGYGQTPSAVPYNGLLDVTLVSKPPIFQVFHGLWLLLTGHFLSHRGLSVWRTSHLSFEKAARIPISIDGRLYHHSCDEVSIEIMPEEIEFLVK